MRLALILVTMSMFGATAVSAAPCRDAKGRFIKCAAAAAPKAKCRDAKGHFAKCGSPGAKPA